MSYWQSSNYPGNPIYLSLVTDILDFLQSLRILSILQDFLKMKISSLGTYLANIKEENY